MKWLGPSFLEGFIWAQIQRPSLYYSFICGLRLSSSRREAHFGSQRRNVHSASIQFAANFASRCLETSEPSAAKYLFPLNFYIFFAFFFSFEFALNFHILFFCIFYVFFFNLRWIFTFYIYTFFFIQALNFHFPFWAFFFKFALNFYTFFWHLLLLLFLIRIESSLIFFTFI